jgi:hypothetical protein
VFIVVEVKAGAGERVVVGFLAVLGERRCRAAVAMLLKR